MNILQKALLAVAASAPLQLASAAEQAACPYRRSVEEVEFNKRELATSAIIDNGVVKLGINDGGALNVPGDPDAHSGETYVGLRYFRDGGWYDSTAFGCKCEGFGASASVNGTDYSFFGGSNQNYGEDNLSVSPIASDGVKAKAMADITTGPMSVSHEFSPSEETDNLYQVVVTLTNTSPDQTLTELRYRRVMDWDIPPTIFSECVSIIYSKETFPTDLEYTTDDGFEDNDPRDDRSDSELRVSCPKDGPESCPVFDDGPADHGAMFNFLFKDPTNPKELRTLSPGESFSFKIYYGAAGTKRDADTAIAAVGAEVFSYGYAGENGCNAENSGAPNVFIFGFSGVGGTVFTAPPTVSPAPTINPNAEKCLRLKEIFLNNKDDCADYWDL